MRNSKERKSNKQITEKIKDAVRKLKRQKKIDRLNSSNEWSGLEDRDFNHNELMINEDFNRFISKFRRMYASGKMMRFRDWLKEFEELIDELD